MLRFKCNLEKCVYSTFKHILGKVSFPCSILFYKPVLVLFVNLFIILLESNKIYMPVHILCHKYSLFYYEGLLPKPKYVQNRSRTVQNFSPAFS